jgi:hypothetical protein
MRTGIRLLRPCNKSAPASTAPAPLGVYLVGHWFRIEVTPGSEHPLGVVRCGVWEGQERADGPFRLACVVEAALEQISPSEVGVVVVELGERIDSDVATDALTLRAAERSVFFSTLSFVVLRWKVNAAMRLIKTGAIVPHGRSLTPAAARLARVLVGNAD